MKISLLEILYCTPKGRIALLRIPSSEGRSVCLWWEHSKPKGPKGMVLQGHLAHEKHPPPQGHHKVLDIVLLKGLRRELFLMSEVHLNYPLRGQ